MPKVEKSPSPAQSVTRRSRKVRIWNNISVTRLKRKRRSVDFTNPDIASTRKIANMSIQKFAEILKSLDTKMEDAKQETVTKAYI